MSLVSSCDTSSGGQGVGISYREAECNMFGLLGQYSMPSLCS